MGLVCALDCKRKPWLDEWDGDLNVSLFSIRAACLSEPAEEMYDDLFADENEVLPKIGTGNSFNGSDI